MGFDFRGGLRPSHPHHQRRRDAGDRQLRGRPHAVSGLGTGLGSAMIVDGVVEPMELAHMMYKKGKTYEDYVGSAAGAAWGRKNGGMSSRIRRVSCAPRWKRTTSCWAAATRAS